MSQLFAWGGQVLKFQLQHQSFQQTTRTGLLEDGLCGTFAVQGILKGLLQHLSLKASILQYSAFFIFQLSHTYMTTGKTIALTRWTFVGKVMSLLFNMLSRLVITFLPRSKCLLISWLQSPYAVILETRKIKSATVSTVSPSICHEVMGYEGFHNSLCLKHLKWCQGHSKYLRPLSSPHYHHCQWVCPQQSICICSQKSMNLITKMTLALTL